ncbi:hypothetical protein D6774_04030 [Candidatus Woesearchaeota archaeon]|nr:MAG: hypothetical protein D6774_04030 [Candidatus Woesearchaeota archaeon]
MLLSLTDIKQKWQWTMSAQEVRNTYISKHYFDSDEMKKIEIVSHKKVRLDSPDFIGFYIRKEYLNGLLPLIKKKFPRKIVYDGKKIIRL